MTEIKLLFEPGTINQMVTGNRIVMSSAITNTDDRNGNVTDQTIAYYCERGRGGAGIVNTGYNYVTRPVDLWLPPLRNEVTKVYLIGSCLEPRQLIEAVADGGRVGQLV